MLNPVSVFTSQSSEPVEFGSDHKTVFAPKGHKGPLYNTGGSSRSHLTLSVTVSASGEVAGVRVVYSGKRWSDQESEMIKNLPSLRVRRAMSTVRFFLISFSLRVRRDMSNVRYWS